MTCSSQVVNCWLRLWWKNFSRYFWRNLTLNIRTNLTNMNFLGNFGQSGTRCNQRKSTLDTFKTFYMYSNCPLTPWWQKLTQLFWRKVGLVRISIVFNTFPQFRSVMVPAWNLPLNFVIGWSFSWRILSIEKLMLGNHQVVLEKIPFDLKENRNHFTL